MNILITEFTNSQFKNYLENQKIIVEYYQTPVGILQISMTDNGIHGAIFVNNADEFVLNKNININKLILFGTDFQLKVWKETLKIPFGQMITYQELAQRIGQPTAYRAIANALSQNKIAYFIPCHRVIGKNGKLAGYKWGMEKKCNLLKFERRHLYEENNNFFNHQQYNFF